jgi:gas vesicle protein
MPAKRNRSTEGQEQDTQSNRRNQPGEEYMNAWMDFAKEMGDTAEAFVKRYGEEQQKNYEQWMSTVQDGTKARPSLENVKEVGERFQQWAGLAQEIGERIKESFTSGSDLQKEFFAAWSQASQRGNSPEEISKGFSDLAQKFWTGLTNNLYQKSFTTIRPEVDMDGFIRNQEQTVREFSENVRKLSPPFVSLFGQTLQSTLEIQKLLSENIWTGVRLMANVGEETSAFVQRIYEMNQNMGQLLKRA